MKKLFAVLLIVMLCGCASTITHVSKDLEKSEKALGQRIDVVWKQKECRAAVAKALIETRPASLEAKASAEGMQKDIDPNSEEYKKCRFYAINYSWELYALQDVKNDILPDLLNFVGGW